MWICLHVYGDQTSCVLTEPYFSGPVPTSSKRFNNRYGHLINLEPMQEVEEYESQLSCGISSSRSQGNPSLESTSSEVTESETAAIQSTSNEQRGGEVASTSEYNEPGATKSSEPRLATRVHKNLYDKIPPPARPNSPQRRAFSQPSTPRKRSEAYISLQVCLLSPFVSRSL